MTVYSDERPAEIEFNRDCRPFCGPRFSLERASTDLPGLCAFHSRALSYVGYESFLASALHRLLLLVPGALLLIHGSAGRLASLLK